jgi:predicted nucleic acid-binding protein
MILVSAPVYAELAAAPGRETAAVDEFLHRTGIEVDWALDERTWRLAATAFGAYAGRRRLAGEAGPRRILADFVIGAHASRYASALLTLDRRIYRTAFPDLEVLTPE